MDPSDSLVELQISESSLTICPHRWFNTLSRPNCCWKGLTVVPNTIKITGHRWSIMAQQHLMADCGFHQGPDASEYKTLGCIYCPKYELKLYPLKTFYNTCSIMFGYIFPFPVAQPPVSLTLILQFYICTGFIPSVCLHWRALVPDEGTWMTERESTLNLVWYLSLCHYKVRRTFQSDKYYICSCLFVESGQSCFLKANS